MARYDLEYERGYGLGYGERERYEPAPRYGRPRGRYAPGRGMWGARRREPAYGREFAGRERYGYGREFGAGRPYYRAGGFGYGREYMGYGLGYAAYGPEYGTAGYGREFEKSRWQTDYGDPFRDRERGTPIRMIRGEYGEYGEEFGARERGPEYEVEYRPRWRRYRY